MSRLPPRRIPAANVGSWLFAASVLLLVSIMLSCSPPAVAAPGAATKFAGFLCKIDLVDDGGAYNFKASGYVPASAQEFVYSFASEKLCTNSQDNENVKITCSARIPNWTGPALTQKPVTCTIGGAACGLVAVPGQPEVPLDAINNQLSIDAAGNAVLTCQVK